MTFSKQCPSTFSLARPFGACAFVAALLGCTALKSADDLRPIDDGVLRDAATDAGETCLASGEGTLRIDVDAPAGVTPDVTLDPDDTARSVLKSEAVTVPAGAHTLEARRVTIPGELLGRAYSPSAARQQVCVQDDSEHELEVKYELEPGSQKLWVIHRNGSQHTASFAQEALVESGTPATSTTIASAALDPAGIAFDRHGNLWLADRVGKVLGYTQRKIGVDRSASLADIVIEGSALCRGGVPCGPSALAFDAKGDLWLALPDRVVRVTAEQLVGKTLPMFASTLSGPSINRPLALAFDAEGSLWIANGGDSSVVRFSAQRLGADDENEADITLLGQASGPVFSGLSTPISIAFDQTGNLWVSYFAPSVIVRYSVPEQAASGVVVPALQLGLAEQDVAEGLAFDDAGNLWFASPSKRVTRLSAASLTTEPDPLSEAVILSLSGPAMDLAFNPPAAFSPLAR